MFNVCCVFFVSTKNQATTCGCILHVGLHILPCFFELCAVKIQYLFSVYMLLAFRRRLNPFIKTFQTLSGPSYTFLVVFIFVTRNISNYLFLLLMFFVQKLCFRMFFEHML